MIEAGLLFYIYAVQWICSHFYFEQPLDFSLHLIVRIFQFGMEMILSLIYSLPLFPSLSIFLSQCLQQEFVFFIEIVYFKDRI